jgi:TPR repeat protein
MLCLLAPALLMGCAHQHNTVKAEAKQLGLKEAAYRKLTVAAEAGDKGAAEKLARLWYQCSDDTTKALYWLQVAANNGSKKAAQVAGFANSQLSKSPQIAEE